MGQGDAPGRGEEVRRRGSSSGSPEAANFGRASCWFGGSPMTNYVGSRRFLQEREKGGEEGAVGGFIGGPVLRR
jgi:hypothetical protein